MCPNKEEKQNPLSDIFMARFQNVHVPASQPRVSNMDRQPLHEIFYIFLFNLELLHFWIKIFKTIHFPVQIYPCFKFILLQASCKQCLIEFAIKAL